jgi:hypothetical protein
MLFAKLSWHPKDGYGPCNWRTGAVARFAELSALQAWSSVRFACCVGVWMSHRNQTSLLLWKRLRLNHLPGCQSIALSITNW